MLSAAESVELRDLLRKGEDEYAAAQASVVRGSQCRNDPARNLDHAVDHLSSWRAEHGQVGGR